MRITSPAFPHGGRIPAKYTCDGVNINPPLDFHDVPKEVISLVLIVDDPDSPTGTWNHWAVWNIDPKRTGISEKEKGEWSEGTTTFGNIRYGGPCPGSGTHRYFFKLYALDIKLPLSEGTGKDDLISAVKGHIVAEAELMGRYEKMQK